MSEASVAAQQHCGMRFAFGRNWTSFLVGLDETWIAEAERALQRLLGRDRLDGLRFVDIGSGSGLSSLAARRLGAAVHSFDYDSQSVDCTKALRDRYFPGDANWRVEQGSIIDRHFLAQLGQFDIVYSWGVLHHTGAMRKAIRSASLLVAKEGVFAFALYRKTALCWLWTIEKRWFCRGSPRAQRVACALYVNSMRFAFALLARNFREYLSNYRSNRGMDYFHDVRDWLGGYPYESISPTQVDKELGSLGFTRLNSNVRRYSIGLFGSGCNEYLYARHRN
jgi:SAM-dependent methyltransferase